MSVSPAQEVESFGTSSADVLETLHFLALLHKIEKEAANSSRNCEVASMSMVGVWHCAPKEEATTVINLATTFLHLLD